MSPGQGSLAVGTILASLSVRTTVGLFRVGRQDRGVLDASGESLALLFVLVVLVSEAGNRGGHSRTKVTYEAHFSKSPHGCALRSFSEPCTDCVRLEYASSTQAVQSNGSSFGSSCSSFRSHLLMDCHRCCEAAVAFTVITITKKDNIIHDIVTYLAPTGVGSFVKPQVC